MMICIFCNACRVAGPGQHACVGWKGFALTRVAEASTVPPSILNPGTGLAAVVLAFPTYTNTRFCLMLYVLNLHRHAHALQVANVSCTCAIPKSCSSASAATNPAICRRVVSAAQVSHGNVPEHCSQHAHAALQRATSLAMSRRVNL